MNLAFKAFLDGMATDAAKLKAVLVAVEASKTAATLEQLSPAVASFAKEAAPYVALLGDVAPAISVLESSIMIYQALGGVPGPVDDQHFKELGDGTD